MTLYELTGEYLTLLEMAEDENIDQDTLMDTMEAIGGELEDKADGYAKIISQLAGDAESIKKQIERLTAMKDRIDGNITAMKKSLEAAMIATGKKKFKTQLFSFSIQKNAPSLDLLDEDMVPDMFRVPQPDKNRPESSVKLHQRQRPYSMGQNETDGKSENQVRTWRKRKIFMKPLPP